MRDKTKRRPVIRGKRRRSVLLQVAILFLIGVAITGVVSYFSQYSVSEQTTKEQIEEITASNVKEVRMAVMEYPAHRWLTKYWYEHADEMEIEYDADYGRGTATEEKARRLNETYPGVQLKYADMAEILAMSEEDQKAYAEVCYSWLITRINQIKRSYGISYLFCVITEEPYDSQFFLFSAAEVGAKRGTSYEDTYTIGVISEVNESQQLAMKDAKENLSHLADAGKYVDYYAYLDKLDSDSGKVLLIGMTYDLSTLLGKIDKMTQNESGYAMINHVFLSLICLLLIYLFVLRPLKKIQNNIRFYKEKKDSDLVVRNLEKIRPRNEIGQLSEDISDLALEIDDYLDEIGTITAEKERIGTELSLATRIQNNMIPNVFPPFPEHPEIDIYASMTPAREVGGDFYDYYLVDNDHLCIVMADVSGKGVPAALFMMASKIILANNAMMGKSPAQILSDTNASICSNNQEEMFVTVWLGILELSTGKLTASNAGHEYPAIAGPDGRFELRKERHGFVIGGMDGIAYREYTIQIEPGSKIFLYTDGVPEATDAENRMFGTDRMIDTLNADPDAGPKAVLAGMESAVSAFVGDAEQFDDLTMLCLTYRGPAEKEKVEELTVDAVIENTEAVTDYVNERLEAMGCPMRAQLQIDVAIDEIYSNIARYAYAPKTGPVTVRVEQAEDPNGAVVTFIDRGIPYDPLKKPDPDVTLSADEREIGGLGIFLVKKTMDEMTYSYKDHSNVLKIRKNFDALEQ